jgi:hypothetical protein
MNHSAQIWGLRVERGPDCLIVRLHAATSSSQDGQRLADTIWAILDRHFIYRIILELDQVEVLSDHLLGELVALSHRLRSRGGMLRLCGLSPPNRRKLREACDDGRLPAYASRREATICPSDS